jgi:hypothetical protein
MSILSTYKTKKRKEAGPIFELEINDTTDTDRSASYLDIHLEIDSEGRIRTKLYDKSDYFNLPIVNFPYICSNIPAAIFDDSFIIFPKLINQS